jgi:hypothetical protein
MDLEMGVELEMVKRLEMEVDMLVMGMIIVVDMVTERGMVMGLEKGFKNKKVNFMNLLLETHHIFEDKIDKCDFSEGDGSNCAGVGYIYCSTYGTGYGEGGGCGWGDGFGSGFGSGDGSGLGDGKGSSTFYSSLCSISALHSNENEFAY